MKLETLGVESESRLNKVHVGERGEQEVKQMVEPKKK